MENNPSTPILCVQPQFREHADWDALIRKEDLYYAPMEFVTAAGIPDNTYFNNCREWYLASGRIQGFHGAYMGINPACDDLAIREISQQRCIESCKLAKQLGSPSVTFHSAAFPTLRGEYLDRWAAISAEFFTSLAEEFDLIIAIENSFDVDTLPLKKLMRRANHPKVRTLLDLGHANYTRVPLETWFYDLSEYIYGINLADNYGAFDDHLVLGQGSINWHKMDEYWKEIGAPRHLILSTESFEKTVKSLAFLRKYGYFGQGTEEAEYSLFDSISTVDYVVPPVGNLRDASILMCDLRGFTALSDQFDSDTLLKMLNHYLSEMAEIIEKNHGTILELQGDGIMAVFGAPHPNKQHAADAVIAALEMQNRMEHINLWNIEQDFPVFEIGIGISSGPMTVGNIGSEKFTKYGAIGRDVNLAGRIESYSVGGQILISSSTYERINCPMKIVHEQRVYPKGLSEPTTIYHIIGLGAPYHISCKRYDETPQPLSQSVHLTLHLIDEEKQIDSDLYDCEVTCLGLMSACIRTNAVLTPYSNLVLDIGAPLYAKVLNSTEDGWLIHFTSLPQDFRVWYNSCRINETKNNPK